MKRSIFLTILLISGILNFLYAQKYVLNGTVSQLPSNKVYLLSVRGHEEKIFDSAKVNNYNFQFHIPASSLAGLYKILLYTYDNEQDNNDGSRYLEFIFNHEDIVFSTYFPSLTDSMRIFLSNENTVFYKYQQLAENSGVKMDVLNQLPQFFPKNDDFYPVIKKQYNRELKKYLDEVQQLLKKNQGTFAARYIKSDMLPELQFNIITAEKTEFLKRHFLDKVDFSDTLLLQSDIFSSKAIKYIKLFQNPYFMKALQDKEYEKAVDSIMKKASANDKVYDYLLGYLINGFERIENEEVLTYISEHYSGDNRCKDNDHLSRLNKRVEGFKKIAIGSIAPDILVKDKDEKPVSLASSDAPFTLLVFWATWCPHCVETLPDLKKIYDKQQVKKIEVIAVSLDTNRVSWIDFIKKGSYSWFNCCDFIGWEGKAAQDYFIYATPTMILMNRDRKILGKPKNIKELNKLLKDLGI